jgi:hypothetical protein
MLVILASWSQELGQSPEFPEFAIHVRRLLVAVACSRLGREAPAEIQDFGRSREAQVRHREDVDQGRWPMS